MWPMICASLGAPVALRALRPRRDLGVRALRPRRDLDEAAMLQSAEPVLLCATVACTRHWPALAAVAELGVRGYLARLPTTVDVRASADVADELDIQETDTALDIGSGVGNFPKQMAVTRCREARGWMIGERWMISISRTEWCSRTVRFVTVSAIFANRACEGAIVSC